MNLTVRRSAVQFESVEGLRVRRTGTATRRWQWRPPGPRTAACHRLPASASESARAEGLGLQVALQVRVSPSQDNIPCNSSYKLRSFGILLQIVAKLRDRNRRDPQWRAAPPVGGSVTVTRRDMFCTARSGLVAITQIAGALDLWPPWQSLWTREERV